MQTRAVNDAARIFGSAIDNLVKVTRMRKNVHYADKMIAS